MSACRWLLLEQVCGILNSFVLCVPVTLINLVCHSTLLFQVHVSTLFPLALVTC
jgi:hypothetical protein